MANIFKNVSHDVMPASAGSPEDLYTVPDNTTTVVIGLTLANVHTAQVTASVKLVSVTPAGGRAETNTTTFLAKDIPIAVGQSRNVLAGGKVVLNSNASVANDKIQIDCSVADKVSVTMAIMEIT